MPAPVPPRIIIPDDDDPEVQVLFDLDVLNWRFEALERAGYPVDVSIALSAMPEVDLHTACDLLRDGATVSEAVRILT